MIPLKLSVSKYVGAVKGSTAIRVLNKFHHLKIKPCRRQHFRAEEYRVNTVKLNDEMIRKYLKYQDDK